MGRVIETMDLESDTIQEALRELYAKLVFLARSPIYRRSQVIRYAFGGAESIRAAQLLADQNLARVTVESAFRNIVCIHVDRGCIDQISKVIQQ